MNGVSDQTLRLAAENATPGEWCTDDYGVIADAGLNANYYIASCSGPDNRANKRFIAAANPATVLALLDELERNQQYIKRRDQENEDIALTVGKLRVELEAAKSKLNEQREYYEGVIADGGKRIAELEEIKSAAEKLVRCKGRYHSEQNYRALAKLFGVTVPDLPPLSEDD
ncbi:ead/Ea22-like family protein [Escherichia coli O4:H2]